MPHFFRSLSLHCGLLICLAIPASLPVQAQALQKNAGDPVESNTEALSVNEQAVEEMITALAAFEAISGGFEQQQFDSEGELLLLSSGEFRLLRPGYFAWEIHSPDRQTIIADPQFLWHYDHDLETATRRPVDDSTEFAPLKILGGNAALLRERFHVSSATPGQFLLTPRTTDPAFRELTLVIGEHGIASMELIDTAAQRVLIEFVNVGQQQSLTPDDFAFIPPPGTDVFYHDQ